MRAVIINPASASGRTGDRWRRIVAMLEARGDHFELQLTRHPGNAIEITRRLLADGVRQLTVLGGDGTVGEVVAGCVREDGSGMVADDIELGLIHQGTGGDMVRGLDIPTGESAAVEVALTGALRRIDVGVARFSPLPCRDEETEQPSADQQVRGFVSVANVGMAAEVVERVTGRFKRFGDRGAFALATISCLARNRPRPVQVTTDRGFDESLDIVDIDVCNNRFMGGGMLVAPEAAFDDGRFDVVVIRAGARVRLLRTFPKIYSGRHVDDPLVRVLHASRVDVAPSPGARPNGVVLDGDLVGCTPASFELLPGAVSVRVPAS